MIAITFTPPTLYAYLQSLSLVLCFYIVTGYLVFFAVKDAAARYDSATFKRIVPSLAALAVCALILFLARHGYLPAPLTLAKKAVLLDVCQGQLWWLDASCW